ncbi:hypothetical protein R1sor_003927 [Riccia sorocarpa]|uniref:Ty3 transposon capsid-like protein domain-containing protein n=1 Tax=Riccia sorocarpa TaxID=122646 RepID=A0ABD3H327_9MARC
MEELMQSLVGELREMKMTMQALQGKVSTLENQGGETPPQGNQIGEDNPRAAVGAPEEESALLLRMKKTCNVEPYMGQRAMGVVENWISRMNRYLRLFSTQISDQTAGVFACGYLTDKALTWYDAWERTLLTKNRIVTWTALQAGLLRNFQSVDSVQMARTRMWNLKQDKSLQEYVEAFLDLQVVITDMSGAEALDVFKRELKEKIKKEVMLQNPQTVFEAIACAQRVADTKNAEVFKEEIVEDNLSDEWSGCGVIMVTMEEFVWNQDVATNADVSDTLLGIAEEEDVFKEEDADQHNEGLSTTSIMKQKKRNLKRLGSGKTKITSKCTSQLCWCPEWERKRGEEESEEATTEENK